MSYTDNMGERIEKQTIKEFEVTFMQNYQKKYNYYTKVKPTNIDYPSIKIKDDIIKKLREEITLLNEEIKDLKTDLKSLIEMES
jgi:hypothetical protein